MGPNGADKTTIIRMITNLLIPDSGEVLFDGRPVEEPDKNRIGYLPEERGLYPRQTVEWVWEDAVSAESERYGSRRPPG